MYQLTSHHKTATNIFNIKVFYDTPNIFVLFDRLFCFSLFSFFHTKHLFYPSRLQHHDFNTCWNNWHKYDFLYLNILNVTKLASSNNLMQSLQFHVLLDDYDIPDDYDVPAYFNISKSHLGATITINDSKNLLLVKLVLNDYKKFRLSKR